MNKNQKLLKAKTIQKDIDYWFNIIEQCVESATLSKHNEWVLNCIPDYIKCIDKQLAEAEKLGVDELLNLQGIYENIVKYRQIYDKAIKEEK